MIDLITDEFIMFFLKQSKQIISYRRLLLLHNFIICRSNIFDYYILYFFSCLLPRGKAEMERDSENIGAC